MRCMFDVLSAKARSCMTFRDTLMRTNTQGVEFHDGIAPIAQLVSALDFNFERADEGSILTAGKRLSLKI